MGGQPGWGRGQLGEGIPRELYGGDRHVCGGSLRRATQVLEAQGYTRCLLKSDAE